MVPELKSTLAPEACFCRHPSTRYLSLPAAARWEGNIFSLSVHQGGVPPSPVTGHVQSPVTGPVWAGVGVYPMTGQRILPLQIYKEVPLGQEGTAAPPPPRDRLRHEQKRSRMRTVLFP